VADRAPDVAAVLARARAAQAEAERVRDLAFETWVQAMLVAARAEPVAVPSVVEARLRALLGKDEAGRLPSAESRPVSDGP
jgi:hypothetical protein